MIIVKDIEALEINPKNKLEINLLYKNDIYKLQSLDTIYYAEKWLNSLRVIKDMGDMSTLATDRYAKLKIYNREDAKVAFRDYEMLMNQYEQKICVKIVRYKGSKIFASATGAHRAGSEVRLAEKAAAEAEFYPTDENLL